VFVIVGVFVCFTLCTERNLKMTVFCRDGCRNEGAVAAKLKASSYHW